MTKIASKSFRAKPSAAKPAAKSPAGGRPPKRRIEADFLSDEEFEAEGSLAVDDTDDDADEEREAELDLESEPEPTTGDDDQIDDPVRIYLMQMGEIPLLEPGRRDRRRPSRSSARRRRFRHSMLATDYVLQAAIDLLESIRDGRAAPGPHDRGLGDQPPREEAAD